jgi:molybdate transport system substrate-binding protein
VRNRAKNGYWQAHLFIGFLLCCVPSFGFASERPITIFAAASLQNAITELAQNYTDETGIKVHVSVAGTSTLARQIQHGAPADIFISANKSWVDHLLNRKLLNPNSVSVIAKNSMVLVSRTGVDSDVSVLEGRWDLNSLIVTAMIGSVPAGIYAKEVLEHYGLWKHCKIKLSKPTMFALRFALWNWAKLILVWYISVMRLHQRMFKLSNDYPQAVTVQLNIMSPLLELTRMVM